MDLEGRLRPKWLWKSSLWRDTVCHMESEHLIAATTVARRSEDKCEGHWMTNMLGYMCVCWHVFDLEVRAMNGLGDFGGSFCAADFPSEKFLTSGLVLLLAVALGFREFYQCDFDVVGQYELMEPDFEVIKVLTELLNELNIGDFEIKLNHWKLLDGMLEICGVSLEKFRTVWSKYRQVGQAVIWTKQEGTGWHTYFWVAFIPLLA